MGFILFSVCLIIFLYPDDILPKVIESLLQLSLSQNVSNETAIFVLSQLRIPDNLKEIVISKLLPLTDSDSRDLSGYSEVIIVNNSANKQLKDRMLLKMAKQSRFLFIPELNITTDKRIELINQMLPYIHSQLNSAYVFKFIDFLKYFSTRLTSFEIIKLISKLNNLENTLSYDKKIFLKIAIEELKLMTISKIALERNKLPLEVTEVIAKHSLTPR